MPKTGASQTFSLTSEDRLRDLAGGPGNAVARAGRIAVTSRAKAPIGWWQSVVPEPPLNAPAETWSAGA